MNLDIYIVLSNYIFFNSFFDQWRDAADTTEHETKARDICKLMPWHSDAHIQKECFLVFALHDQNKLWKCLEGQKSKEGCRPRVTKEPTGVPHPLPAAIAMPSCDETSDTSRRKRSIRRETFIIGGDNSLKSVRKRAKRNANCGNCCGGCNNKCTSNCDNNNNCCQSNCCNNNNCCGKTTPNTTIVGGVCPPRALEWDETEYVDQNCERSECDGKPCGYEVDGGICRGPEGHNGTTEPPKCGGMNFTVKGPPGRRGPTGLPGIGVPIPGPEGYPGIINNMTDCTAEKGAPGYAGPPGLMGPDGEPADKNCTPTTTYCLTSQNATNFTGPPGYPSNITVGNFTCQSETIGTPGPRGNQGNEGERGLPGYVGPRGPTGADGLKGYRGAFGPEGKRGGAGRDGPYGTTLTLPPLPGPNGEQGPRGEMGQQGGPGVLGNMGRPGPRGPEGPRGALGEVGPPGPEGPRGERGIRGLPGPIGPRVSYAYCTYLEAFFPGEKW